MILFKPQCKGVNTRREKEANILFSTKLISLLCGLIIVLFSTSGFAQKSTISIAPFTIQLTNGNSFTYQQLNKKQSVALIYFDPDCDHCHLFTQALIKRSASLKNKQLVMITYRPLPVVKAFYQQYKLQQYPFIKMGTEGETFIVRKHYNIVHFPFVAIHEVHKSTAILYNQPVTNENEIEKLIAELSSLK